MLKLKEEKNHSENEHRGLVLNACYVLSKMALPHVT